MVTLGEFVNIPGTYQTAEVRNRNGDVIYEDHGQYGKCIDTDIDKAYLDEYISEINITRSGHLEIIL